MEEEVGKVSEKAGVEGGKVARRSRSFEESTKSSRLRRKSLDSPSSSETMKAIVRLNALEAKVGEEEEEGERKKGKEKKEGKIRSQVIGRKEERRRKKKRSEEMDWKGGGGGEEVG